MLMKLLVHTIFLQSDRKRRDTYSERRDRKTAERSQQRLRELGRERGQGIEAERQLPTSWYLFK